MNYLFNGCPNNLKSFPLANYNSNKNETVSMQVFNITDFDCFERLHYFKTNNPK